MAKVLIVGAGPTGLVLALWLTRLGIRVRIIDRTAGPGTASRALGIQARTLELYRLLGLAEAVVAAGHRTRTTIRPSRITRMTSASRMVDRRCAMVIVVRDSAMASSVAMMSPASTRWPSSIRTSRTRPVIFDETVAVRSAGQA